MSEYQDKIKGMIGKKQEFKSLARDESHKLERAKKMVDLVKKMSGRMK